MKYRFTKSALAGLMAVSLAACGSGSTTSGTSAAGASAGADSGTTDVAYKDTFTYAIGGEPSYLDPGYADDSVTSYVLNQIYYPMYYIAEDGSMVAAAVKDEKYDEDTMTYTFTLRDDLKWSDGQPCVAGDYVYGMKHALSLGAADSYYSYFMTDYVLNAAEYIGQPVDTMTDLGITAPDDTTIVIQLANKCPYLLSLLSAGVFYPMREDQAKSGDYTWADDASIPTNGPFHPTSIDRASEIVMEKNEYFPDADQITVNTMTCEVMADMDAQLLAYQTGEIDYATSLDPSVAKTYADSDELILASSVINYFVLINSFGDVEALHDANVRRALSLGVDRSAIVTALDVPGVYYELDGLVPVGIPGDTGDFREEADAEEKYTYTDKDEARSLMEAAGYSADNPLKLTYYYNQNSMHDTVAAVLKEQWADIYVDLTLQTGEIRTFFQDRSDGNFELARHAFSADYMDPSTFLDMPLQSNQPSAHVWGDDTYDQMIMDSRELEGSERYAKLHEAEKYLVEEQSYIVPLFGYKSVMLAKPGTTGYIPNPQGNAVFWYVKVPQD